jgi:hypothetical protein
VSYQEVRLPFDARRETLWRTLCRHFFQAYAPEDGVVLELGAGYGHFINNIRASRRIALDRWPGLAEHVQPGVECRIGEVTDLQWLADRSVDLVFASNLFEHLPRPALLEVFGHVRRILTERGALMILQPNYRYAYKEYFDDYTHEAVYSAQSMSDLLAASGFTVLDRRDRFLPLTVKSRLPVAEWLIRLYLASPYKPLAKQMMIHACPNRRAG